MSCAAMVAGTISASRGLLHGHGRARGLPRKKKEYDFREIKEKGRLFKARPARRAADFLFFFAPAAGPERPFFSLFAVAASPGTTFLFFRGRQPQPPCHIRDSLCMEHRCPRRMAWPGRRGADFLFSGRGEEKKKGRSFKAWPARRAADFLFFAGPRKIRVTPYVLRPE